MRKLIAAPLCAVALTLAACSGEDTGGNFAFHSPGGQREIFYEEADRKPLAGLEGKSLTEEGQTISLSDFEDQVVVLNAWGQWCAPCRAEVDDLQQVHEYLQEQNSGTVLGINVRDPNPQIALDFLADNGATYPSIYDPPFKTAANLGGVPSSVIPTTIVLDKQHRPAAVFLREITADDLLEVIDRLAGEA